MKNPKKPAKETTHQGADDGKRRRRKANKRKRTKPTLDEINLFSQIANYLKRHGNTSQRDLSKVLGRSVSASIRSLEETYKKTLVFRTGYTCHGLTQEGEIFYAGCIRVLDAHGALTTKQIVSVGTMNNILVNLLPPAVDRYVSSLRKRKDVQLEFWEDDYPEILAYLRRGVIDFGIGWLPSGSEDYTDIDFEDLPGEVERWCIWQEDYRAELTKKRSVSFRDLEPELVIIPSPAYQPGIDALASPGQSVARQVIKVKNYESVYALVCQGIGVGVVPSWYKDRKGVKGAVVKDERLGKLKIATYLLRGRELSDLARDFLNTIKQTLGFEQPRS